MLRICKHAIFSCTHFQFECFRLFATTNPTKQITEHYIQCNGETIMQRIHIYHRMALYIRLKLWLRHFGKKRTEEYKYRQMSGLAGPGPTKASWVNRDRENPAKAGWRWRAGPGQMLNTLYIYSCLLFLERRVGTSPLYQYVYSLPLWNSKSILL